MSGLNLPAPVSSVVDAVNRHDEEAFLDAFIDGGYVDDWGRQFHGRDQIKEWSEREFVGADGTLTPREGDVEGDVVTVIADWSSTHANGLSRFEFVPEAGRIASMTIREG